MYLADPNGSCFRTYCHVSFSLQLRKQTGARIDVDTEDVGDERVLLISGFPVQVCKAKAAIHQILTENTPVSEQLSVPQRSVGRIIGTAGQLPLLFPFFFPFAFFLTFPRIFPAYFPSLCLGGGRRSGTLRPELYFFIEPVVKQSLLPQEVV